ncbi:MAG: hypothetical protein R3D00_25075 [Bacteroidia bacterium]
MKKYLLFIAIVAGGWHFSSAQGFGLGPRYKENIKGIITSPEILGSDESGYYVYQNVFYYGSYLDRNKTENYIYPRKSVPFRKFGKDLRLEAKAKIQFGTPNRPERAMGGLMLKDRIFLFSVFNDRTEGRSELFVREMNKQALTIPVKGKSLGKVSFESSFFKGFMQYFFVTSADTSRILVVGQLPQKKGLPEKFVVKVLSDDMTLLWSKEVVLPYQEELFSVSSFSVDNSGKVYILGKNYFEKKDESVGRKPNYNFKILILESDKQTPSELTIDLEDKFLIDVNIEPMENGQIVCAGAFSEKINATKVKGIYYLAVDPESNKIIKESYTDLRLSMFGDDDDLDDEDKPQKPRDKRAFYNYVFRKMIPLSDGRTLLVAEEQYEFYNSTTTTTSTKAPNAGVVTSTTTQHYIDFYRHNIIVVVIGTDGSIEKASMIRKWQHSINEFISLSYGIFRDNSNLYFVFNDHIKNLDAESDNKIRPFGSSVRAKKYILELVTLDSKGEIFRSQLTTLKEARSVAIPTSTYQVSPHEAVLFFQFNKKRRLGRISF